MDKQDSMQEVNFKIRNNLGMLQRFAGIFSRRGIAIKSLKVDEVLGKNYSHNVFELSVAFEGDSERRRIIESQIEKMADFVCFNDAIGSSVSRKKDNQKELKFDDPQCIIMEG